MRRRLLRFLGTFTFRRAWLILPLVVLLTTVAALSLRSLRIETSLAPYLPPTSEEATNIRDIVSDHRKLEPVMVVIQAREAGREAELKNVVQEFARLCDDPHYFSTPVYKVDELAQQYYDSISNIRLIQLLTRDDWEDLTQFMSARLSADRLRRLRAYRINALCPPAWQKAALQDPIGALEALRDRLANSRGPTRLAPRDGYFLSPDGKAIMLLLYPVLSPEDAHASVRTLRFLKRCEAFVFDRHKNWDGSFKINFRGSMITTGENIQRLRDELMLIVKISIPLALLLILLVFRKLEAVVFILLPPIIGLIWTLAIAQAVFGSVSGVTGVFLLVILAIGLQAAIHLYHRFTLELYRNHNYYRALNRSYVETGRGVLATSVVIAFLFFLLLLTSLDNLAEILNPLYLVRESSGFGRLGLIAALGILANLVACLISIPLLASIKHWLARGRVKPVALYRFGLERLYLPAIFTPRTTLVIMLLIAVVFGYGARELDFYPRFASISPFLYRAQPVQRDGIADGFPRPGRPVIAIVHGRTRQEALERNDRLFENLRRFSAEYNILAYDSLRTILPSRASQQASLARLDALDLSPFEKLSREVSRQVGFKPEIWKPFIDALKNFKEKAANPEWIDFTAAESDALIMTVSRYVTSRQDGYYIATAIYPRAEGFEPWRIQALRRDLGAGLDQLTLIGDPVTERELARFVKYNLAVMILLSFFIILLALILHFKRLRLAWITFIPLVVEVVWLCGAMALADLQMHFFTILVMPLILCLSMDNAMQVTQYYEDRLNGSVRLAMVSLGRVVVLSCGTIGLLYGTLAMSSFEGLRDFGATLLLGLIMILFGSVMLLPALLQLFGRGQPVLPTLAMLED